MRMIILFYIVIGFLCAFELISYLLASNYKTKFQIASLGNTGLFFAIASLMGLVHNQIILILGHGYRDKTAQLYVDSLSTVEECIANLSIVRSMYLFSAIMNIVCLWIIWGAWGTPFYKGTFGIQLDALLSVIEVFGQQLQVTIYDGYPPNALKLKPLYWLVSSLLFTASLLAVLGWIQAGISRLKITPKKEIRVHE